MKSVWRALRLLGPFALGGLLVRGVVLGGQPIAALRGTSGFLYVILIVASLLRWPRLWVLVPGLLVTRIAVGFGAVDWTAWVDNTATIQIAVPLILIGVSSAYRRLPSPVPNAPGTIVPNADGIGALLALPIVLPCAVKGWWFPLVVLALGFAGLRTVLYAGKGELGTRGRGWVAFLLGFCLMVIYAFYWARPDTTMGWHYATRGGLVIGVVAWAIQRAIIPWRNPTTVP